MTSQDNASPECKTVLALKYADYHNWRDLESAKRNGWRWPNGSAVTIADPEMRPWLDKFSEDLMADPEKLKVFLKNINYCE